jgi:hypothetical protein
LKLDFPAECRGESIRSINKKACSSVKRNRLSLTNKKDNKVYPYILISVFLRQPGHPSQDPSALCPLISKGLPFSETMYG